LSKCINIGHGKRTKDHASVMFHADKLAVRNLAGAYVSITSPFFFPPKREKLNATSAIIVQNDKELSSLMEKKNFQGHLGECKDMGLKKLHGKNGFDRPRRELLLSLLS
jgi:hypothetical protein